MFVIKIKLWYRDGAGREEDLMKKVDYVPDAIHYKEMWWKKTTSAIDLDTGRYTKVHYEQETLEHGKRLNPS
ncbi:MAG: hypothetical protein K0R18_287 [Bacillales bacterium]|jgi:hypothetical protein|nr:hypothetical protein [Bacillales bacterium]